MTTTAMVRERPGTDNAGGSATCVELNALVLGLTMMESVPLQPVWKMCPSIHS
jgi:hypothetical protein